MEKCWAKAGEAARLKTILKVAMRIRAFMGFLHRIVVELLERFNSEMAKLLCHSGFESPEGLDAILFQADRY
jgi:hypothetical protein